MSHLIPAIETPKTILAFLLVADIISKIVLYKVISLNSTIGHREKEYQYNYLYFEFNTLSLIHITSLIH